MVIGISERSFVRDAKWSSAVEMAAAAAENNTIGLIAVVVRSDRRVVHDFGPLATTLRFCNFAIVFTGDKGGWTIPKSERR